METNEIAVLEKHFKIWNEHNKEIRRTTFPQVYTSDVEVFDPHVAVEGYEKLNDVIQGLHSRFPEYRLTLLKPIEQHHNVARLYWQLGSSEQPDVITGMDVFIMKDGKIETLIIFIDPK